MYCKDYQCDNVSSCCSLHGIVVLPLDHLVPGDVAEVVGAVAHLKVDSQAAEEVRTDLRSK